MKSEGSGTTIGVRHPSTFVDNDYLYVFYVDNDYLSVARVKITGYSFSKLNLKKCLNGEFSSLALPEGFDKNSREFFKVAAGDSDKILRHNGTISFSVAKIKGTDYYLGVEE